jgi:hypothetical protein
MEERYHKDECSLENYSDFKFPDRREKRDKEALVYPRPYKTEDCVICHQQVRISMEIDFITHYHVVICIKETSSSSFLVLIKRRIVLFVINRSVCFYFEICSRFYNPLLCFNFLSKHHHKGQQRGGLYPSGLAFTFLCEDHCPVEARGGVRIEQMALRKKYQINEGDLDQIPGRNRTKRKKKRPTPVREGPSGRSAAG